MAAESAVFATSKTPLRAGHDDIRLRAIHGRNPRHHRSSSLGQLLLAKNVNAGSNDERIPAIVVADPAAISFLGPSYPVIDLAEHPGNPADHSSVSRESGSPSRPAGSRGGGEGRTSSDGSEECSTSGGWSKPHKGNDARWKAIREIISRDGDLGLGHFVLQKKLGCGDIGTVYLAELIGTSCSFAMKIMNKGALESRKKMPRAQTERDILGRLDHPFLPTLYTHFETEQHSCLVMEYCSGGDLHALRQRRPSKCFSEQAARFYAAEILLALEYLHMLGIVYRDLKPENVLVREDGHIMLSDFDLSLCCTFSPTLMIRASNSGTHHSNKSFASASGHCVQTPCVKPDRKSVV